MPVEMAFLVEFDRHGTDPNIPASNIVWKIVEFAVQLLVDSPDFTSEIGCLDVRSSQARARRRLNVISGVREEPL